MDKFSVNDYVYGLIREIQGFLEKFGWPILFGFIILYNIYPFVDRYISNLSLQVANRPERRAILDDELRRVRAKQQEEQRRISLEQKFVKLDKNKVEKTKEEKDAAEEALKLLITKHKKDNPSNLGVDSCGLRQRGKRGG